MRYAEVAVDAPIGFDRTLSYRVPPRVDLVPGQMVWVPLGTRPVRGVAVRVSDHPQVEEVKDLIAAVEPSPLVPPIGIELAHWISRYYLSSLFGSLALLLPPGFESRVRPWIRSSAGRSASGLTPLGRKCLDYLEARREVREGELTKALGKGGEEEVRRLLRRGLLRRRWELPRPAASHRYDSYVRPSEQPGEAPAFDNRAPKQRALLDALNRHQDPLPLTLARKEFGAAAVDALLKRGMLALEWVRVEREPRLGPGMAEAEGPPVTLTGDQARSLAEIDAALTNRPDGTKPFLLHGVTGSGKTEVYLRALERCVSTGRQGIFLVPEISLTPQAVHRINARFPGRVAVLHSRLSVGELFDQWWGIKDGHYDVVVGPRSALFAPLPDLGAIVVDEEHEWTYKQHDSTPRYHSREVAIELGRLAGAVVVMGSATPDVGTYHRASAGGYRLLELTARVPPSGRATGNGGTDAGALARVEVSDMRRELREGNRSIFGRPLAVALSQCVDKGEQAVLFLNRRGSSTVVQCRDCGHALRCRRCSVTFTYHAADTSVLCHQCNARTRVPRGCPQCRSPRIRYLGLGTQRVTEEVGRLLPGVSVLRWDSDAARAPHAHEDIMERFVRGEAQVLVGTQMVAKGLHVPNVTLVGVVLADIGLNLPDFRAGERAFQLMCQVAGRAGRGASPGRVVIQTYSPENYAVQAAAAQDYRLFYDQEVGFRRRLAVPPFGRLVHLVYLHTNPESCKREAMRMGRMLRHRIGSMGLTDVDVVGPAPGFPERVRGRYRWHVVLRGFDLHSFLEGVTVPQGWMVDVDPVSVT